MRVNMSEGWEEWLLTQTDKLFEEKLGPAIEADAKRYAPKHTGELAESIGHHVEDHTLVVEAKAPYAAYVELGHRIVAWGHDEHKLKAPEPYLRPALYQPRSE